MERTPHYDSYVKILKEELIPAMGCTEPIAIALASARFLLHFLSLIFPSPGS